MALGIAAAGRQRRSRFGGLVQWDTSEHDWLEGHGEKLYRIAMIDDATSRLFARFVRRDTTGENMKLLQRYPEKFGRPLGFYTDKARTFRTAEKRKRDEPGVAKDPFWLMEAADERRKSESSPHVRGRQPFRNRDSEDCSIIKGYGYTGSN